MLDAYISNWMSTVLKALAVLALARLAPGPETISKSKLNPAR